MIKRLVVVGSINLDLVATTPRIPVVGETVSGTSFRTFPGGKGANQAVAAARLGRPVSMIGKVGSDAFGQELRSNLAAAGVDTSAVEAAPGASGVAQILTAPNGENVIVVVPGANGQVGPSDIDRYIGVIRSAGIILTQLETPLDTVIHLGVIARREGIPLMLDPAPARALPEELFRLAEWLTPNESETCVLLGLQPQELAPDELEEVAEALHEKGAKNLVLKLGNRGCFLSIADQKGVLVPAYKVRAVDTTAAGDAFNAAFAVSLVNGLDAVQSASWASAVAAISVTRHGAQPAMPTREEVENFIGVQQGKDRRESAAP